MCLVKFNKIMKKIVVWFQNLLFVACDADFLFAGSFDVWWEKKIW